MRGAKRRILAVTVESDGAGTSKDFGPWNGGDRDALVAHMAAGGAFAALRQRPFDVLANPADTPRAIYVSGFDSSPLAVDTGVAVEGRTDDLQRGIDALGVLAGAGGVHVGTRWGDNTLNGLTGCTLSSFNGPHPAGNVGVQIHHTAPINKGEVLWTGIQDAINLGAFLNRAIQCPRVVAVCGSEMKPPSLGTVAPAATSASAKTARASSAAASEHHAGATSLGRVRHASGGVARRVIRSSCSPMDG